LSERTGVSFELLKVVREALGFAEPRPEDRVREDELSVVQAIELQLSKGFRPVVIERWLRVYGDSLRRITETETAGYATEVVRPLLEAGMTEGEMLEAQADEGSRMGPSPNRPSLPSTMGGRNTPGARPSSSMWRARWRRPVCTAGYGVRRRCASSTSPGTRA
jgi:hypothetical protein